MAEGQLTQLDALKSQLESILLAVFGAKIYNESKNYAKSHPFLFLAFTLVSLFSAIPVVIFLGFATITLIIAVLCFLMIEGSIIVIGGIVLVAVVSFISIITLGIVSGIATAYWMTRKFCKNFNSTTLKKLTSTVSSTEVSHNE